MQRDDKMGVFQRL